MSYMPPAISGDFSITDLVREAAERSIAVNHVVTTDPRLSLQSMSGTLMAEEVQPGLLLSGYDLVYTADGEVAGQIEPSIFCGLLLDGESQSMRIIGQAPLVTQPQRVAITGYGDPSLCTRPWRAGQRSRAFGITLKPEFFDRFAASFDGDGLDALRRFLAPGLHRYELPRSRMTVDLAEQTLNEPYGGALRTLHRESQALRFMLEVAAMLQEEQQLVQRLGRRQYDRVRDAREILDGALVDPPKLLDLARALGVNVTTLQANFKAAFGTTIFGYLRDRRLEIGRMLILEYGLGVAEAGYKVGFTNAAAFTAAYRRHFGRPPTAEFRSGTRASSA